MNQLQVFIILNVLPILIFAGAYLYYLQGKTKTRKKWLIIIGVLCVLITWKSFDIHERLFPQPYCRGGFQNINANPTSLSLYHKIFNVKYSSGKAIDCSK